MGAPTRLLERVPLFAHLDELELTAVAQRFRERRFDQGTEVTSERSHGVGFFVIAEGTATVRVHGDAVRRIGPGEHFGEVAAVDGGRRSARLVADTNMVCYGIGSTEFKALVTEHPTVAWALIESVVAKLRETEDRLPRGGR
jgi:CRP/FNR family cyclic AMP-dependent transcriptional regulator